MTVEEREAFYDAEVAPVLLDLCRRCNENGLSFVTLVEWGKGDVGVTCQLTEAAGPQARWSRMASLCRGNVDTLLIEIMKEAREHGHSSVVLKSLGVPHTPKEG